MNIEKPQRLKHSYTQALYAEPKAVFPLLCPVMEAAWVPHWQPSQVLTNCGVIERNCMFTTPEDDGTEAIWITTKHDPEDMSLEMYKVVPGQLVQRLNIQLEKCVNLQTNAHITIERTALGDDGQKALAGFTQEAFVQFMKWWEDAINHFLKTGKMIEA